MSPCLSIKISFVILQKLFEKAQRKGIKNEKKIYWNSRANKTKCRWCNNYKQMWKYKSTMLKTYCFHRFKRLEVFCFLLFFVTLLYTFSHCFYEMIAFTFIGTHDENFQAGFPLGTGSKSQGVICGKVFAIVRII